MCEPLFFPHCVLQARSNAVIMEPANKRSERNTVDETDVPHLV